jgi:hypothetical protein
MKKFRKLATLAGGVLLIALAAYAVYAWFVVEKESNVTTVDIGGPLYEREFISAATGDGFLPGETISFGSKIKHKNSGSRDVIASLDLRYNLNVNATTNEITGFYAKFDMAKLAQYGYDADEIIAEFQDDYQLINNELYMTEERFEELFFLFMPVPDEDNWVEVKENGVSTGQYFVRVKAGEAIEDNEKILGVTQDLGGRSVLPDGSRTPNRPFEQFINVTYKKQVQTTQPSVKAFKSVFGDEAYASLETAGKGLSGTDSWFDFD